MEGGLKGLVSLGKETGEVYPAEAQVRGDGGLSSGEKGKGQKPSCSSTFLLETSGIYHLVPAWERDYDKGIWERRGRGQSGLSKGQYLQGQ